MPDDLQDEVVGQFDPVDQAERPPKGRDGSKKTPAGQDQDIADDETQDDLRRVS